MTWDNGAEDDEMHVAGYRDGSDGTMPQSNDKRYNRSYLVAMMDRCGIALEIQYQYIEDMGNEHCS